MEEFVRPTIFLIAIIALARISALFSRRFDLPTVTVQLLTGILLGPSGLNFLGGSIVMGTWGSPSPSTLHTALKILAEIGLIQLMFLAGMQTDWQALKKRLNPIFFTTISGFVLTAMIVAIITRLFVDRWSDALGLSAVMSASSFGISIYYFSERKILDSQVALMVLGAAILSDLLAILLMIASQATNYAVTYGAFKMTIAVSWFLAKLIMFFAIAYFLTSRFLKLGTKSGLDRNVPRPAYGGIGGVKGHNMKENYLTGKPQPVAGELQKRPRQMLIGYLLLIASLYAWAAMHFGSFVAICVASLGGALLGMSNSEVKEKIAKGFGSIVASIPIGVLFVVLGMEVNLKEAEGTIIFLAILLVCVVGAKLVGSWIATKIGYQSSRERALIMFGGLAQGEMGILIAAYLFSRGLLIPSSFNVSIIVVIMLTTLTPIAMKVAQIKFNVRLNVGPSFTGGEKRNRLVTKN